MFMGMSIHSKMSFDESKAIRILSDFLESNNSIKTFFGENDKTPNHDGYFEILKGTDSIKKQFVVQIKKVENLQKETTGKNANKYLYDLKTNFLYYIKEKVTENPAIYFVVDIATKNIFWLYLSDETLMHLDFEGQKSKRYAFSDNDILIDINEFERVVNQIADERNKKFINKTEEQIAEIQEAAEFINSLLNGDLSFIKEEMFPRLWRFGIANTQTNDMKISVMDRDGGNAYEMPSSSTNMFALYPQIKGKPDYGFKEFDNMNNYFNHFDMTGTLTPMKYVKSALSKIINDYFNNHLCIKIMPTIALSEIVFSFVDEFEKVCELSIGEKTNEKDVKEIHQAFSCCLNYISHLLSGKDLSENESASAEILKRNITSGYIYQNKLDVLKNVEFSMCGNQLSKLYRSSENASFNANLLGIVSIDYIVYFLAISELKERKVNQICRIWDYNYWEIIKNENSEICEINRSICRKWFSLLQEEYVKLYEKLFEKKIYFSKGKFEYAIGDICKGFNDVLVCIRKYESELLTIDESKLTYSELSEWKDGEGILEISHGAILGSFIRNRRLIYDSLRCLLCQGICKAIDVENEGILFSHRRNKIFE